MIRPNNQNHPALSWLDSGSADGNGLAASVRARRGARAGRDAVELSFEELGTECRLDGLGPRAAVEVHS